MVNTIKAHTHAGATASTSRFRLAKTDICGVYDCLCLSQLRGQSKPGFALFSLYFHLSHHLFLNLFRTTAMVGYSWTWILELQL